MATTKGLSIIFWFQAINSIFLGEVTKFQEKSFVVSEFCSETKEGGETTPVTIGLKLLDKAKASIYK